MKDKSVSNFLLFALFIFAASVADAFVVAPRVGKLNSNGLPTQNRLHEVSVDMMSSDTDWVELVPPSELDETKNSPVKKQIITQGSGEIPSNGDEVEIEYIGTLGSSQETWSVDDVVECWLKTQQGLYDILESPFRENGVNGKLLMDENAFTEDFVGGLGISNRIQCKKTIMAAKRLAKQNLEFEEGAEFDSSISRGKTYKFTLGSGKVIKAMDLAVASMKVGEKAMIQCRADFGYGSEGYRKPTGEVIVPPYATLNFEIELK
jgi:hypothetical protein